MTPEERREGKERQIRAAMERLLTGRAIHAGDRLDVVGLAQEAGISRQDLYRAYRPLLEEFRAHRQRLEASTGATDRRTERIRRLSQELHEANGRAARYRAERDGARRERDANASRVAYLEEQNRLLRDQLDAEGRISNLFGR